MPDKPKRCYKCGLVRCETCGGHGTIENFVDEDSRAETVHAGAPLIVMCPDCKGGWQEAEIAARYMAYDFLLKPFHEGWMILEDLGLVTPKDYHCTDHELSVVAFGRAKKRGLVRALAEKIGGRSFRTGTNPAVLCPECKPQSLLRGMKIAINFKAGGKKKTDE